MTGYRVELTDLPEGDYLWVTPEEIKKTYSLPGAFKAYTKLIR
jgi:A/G-specific adenine glycosylase